MRDGIGAGCIEQRFGRHAVDVHFAVLRRNTVCFYIHACKYI
jgi:hypothetical protein